MIPLLFSVHMIYILALLALLYSFSAASDHRSYHNRRILHHPFFPVDPPSSSPQPQPQPQPQPKYPFSTLSPPTDSHAQNPFFPSYSPPPPLPPPPPHFSAAATFPANISSLILPHSSSTTSEKGVSAKLLALIVSFSLLSAALLIIMAAFLLHRHQFHHRRLHDSKNDSLHLFPPDSIPSDRSTTITTVSNFKKLPQRQPPKLTHPTASSHSSEFLYLGTLVSSRDVDFEAVLDAQSPRNSNAADDSASAPLHYQRHGSPELRPLPPLPRNHFQNHQNFKNSNMGSDGEEEFFSPRGSTGGGNKQSPEFNVTIASGRNLPVQNFRSRSSNSSHYSESNSLTSSPSIVVDLTPINSAMSRSPDSLVNFPGPLRGIPPPLPRERKPLSPLASSTGDFETSPSRVSSFSGKIWETTAEGIGVSGRYGDVSFSPPAPPPLPPPRFWETPVVSSGGPPPLVAPSRPVLGHNVGNFGTFGGRDDINNLKPKLKPLHWDKVRASSDKTMVWDQLKSSSFQVDEEMIETLFMVNSSSNNSNQGGKRSTSPLLSQEFQVLDPKKSQNIAILLRALNVTSDEVCEALLEGNADILGTELLDSLLKMAPTHEEEQRLKDFKDESPLKLGPAEKFLKSVLHVPRAFTRVDALLYMANFDSEVEYLKKSYETLEEACKELRSSKMFLKLLEAVLKTGNRMNDGTNLGDAHAFTLDTLLKLVDVKGTDGKTTLLHFVVQEIIRLEGSRLAGADQNPHGESDQHLGLQNEVELRKRGLQVVSSLSGELSNVKKAASMDSESFSSDVFKLGSGITKVIETLKMNEDLPSTDGSRKFSESMNAFLKKAEEDIIKIHAQESVTLSMVKDLTEYFHGNSMKEEAHPFRIFMVVRDFLTILDQVCKDVGKMNDRTIVSSSRQFPLLINAAIPHVSSGLGAQEKSYSADDESVSSS